jgi:hypothetical protein
MAFNLQDYEDVATLNKWFIANYPMGRSDISVISHDPEKGYILVQATLWRDSKDSSPAASNIAFGSRETYIQNMKKFYVEDTCTSALGRAILNLKGSDKTATQDDMKKVDNEPIKNIYGKSGNSKVIEMALRKSFADDVKSGDKPATWSVGEAIQNIPSKPNEQTCLHGVMMLKQGSRNGKDYYGYVCTAARSEQCDAVWGKKLDNGSWWFPTDTEIGKGGE